MGLPPSDYSNELLDATDPVGLLPSDHSCFDIDVSLQRLRGGAPTNDINIKNAIHRRDTVALMRHVIKTVEKKAKEVA